MIEERDIRQRDIIPPDRLAGVRATVVGVGAIGRQVALQLTAMGMPWLQLIDPDVVEPANLACQGFCDDDVGCEKVDAVSYACRKMNSRAEVIAVPSRFQRHRDVGDVLFCCVDTIGARQLIWDAVKRKVKFLVDGRMAAEVLRVSGTISAPRETPQHLLPRRSFKLCSSGCYGQVVP